MTEPRDAYVQARVPRRVRDIIRDRARQAGMSMSAYIVWVCAGETLPDRRGRPRKRPATTTDAEGPR